MTVRINLKKAERKVLPDDDYLFSVAVCEQRPAKVSGNPNLHLELLVDEETHPEFANARVFTDLSLLEQSWFRTVELLEAVRGESLTAEDEEGNMEFEPEDLIGQMVGARVTVDDQYDGIPRNKVTQFFAVAEFGGEAAEGEVEVEEEVKAKKAAEK